MQYRLKIVFVDSQELILETTEKHGFSDDLELFEVTTADEIFVSPLKPIKYIACDSKIFKNFCNQYINKINLETKKGCKYINHRFLKNKNK